MILPSMSNLFFVYKQQLSKCVKIKSERLRRVNNHFMNKASSEDTGISGTKGLEMSN